MRDDEEESAAKEKTGSAQGCPVAMHDGRACGRPIHAAPSGVDERPVCLMHSRDAQKNDAQFQAEFESILKAAGNGIADFTKFVFPGADYHDRGFAARCFFHEATFTKAADFRGTTFTQDADFRKAIFTQHAFFPSTAFTGDAGFVGAVFTENAQFVLATFGNGATFIGTTFTKDADFSLATFAQDANFYEAKFQQYAGFLRTKFLGAAEFRETKFREDGQKIPGAVFSLAEFSQPEAVVFYKTYLGQTLFHNCDVSKLTFSSVEWRTRKGSGKRMVFEEEVDLNHRAGWAVKPKEGQADERDYGLIAEIYQQLKKNYDDRKDYWTAGDFHYGELEMKRLASRRKNPVWCWLHRRLGLVAWYKYASEYGESYLRPALLLGLVLVVFALLYPAAGLRYEPGKDLHVGSGAGAPATLTYGHPFRPGEQADGPQWLARSRLAWHGLWASIFVALFQKELVYDPVYLRGRALAAFEQALTSTLFALFLLAVRRQFRR